MEAITTFKIEVDYSECSRAYDYGTQTWIDTSEAGMAGMNRCMDQTSRVRYLEHYLSLYDRVH